MHNDVPVTSFGQQKLTADPLIWLLAQNLFVWISSGMVQQSLVKKPICARQVDSPQNPFAGRLYRQDSLILFLFRPVNPTKNDVLSLRQLVENDTVVSFSTARSASHIFVLVTNIGLLVSRNDQGCPDDSRNAIN